MAGLTGLNGRWVLVAVVCGLHATLLEWLARDLESPSALSAMPAVMLTRTLTPVATVQGQPAPPAMVARRERSGAREAVRPPRSAASAATPPAGDVAQVAAEPQPSGSADAVVSPAARFPEGPAASVPAGPDVASLVLPVAGASAAGSVAASAPIASAQVAAGWPDTTRLSYQLDGRFRSGDLFGSAQVFWQREESQYQVRIDVDITLFAKLSMVSQGAIDGDQLVPRVFEEIRPGRKRRSARFESGTITLDNGSSVQRPANTQDAASQFVQLTHDFSIGRARLEVGRSVELWMARPGGLDLWVYDVAALEEVTTPGFGRVSAYHLRPRPIVRPRGNITMEMWYAPSLQYLPVRIRLRMGDEAVLDLTAEKIEQR